MSKRALLYIFGAVLLVGAASFVSGAARPAAAQTSSTSTKKKKSSSKSKKKAKVKGQAAPTPDRIRDIQTALQKDGSYQGEPTGKWDAASEQAMQKYQADNGWQSKTTPDSRALIKLGLGPDQQHLLNPESAMTTQPHPTPGPATATKASDPTANQPQR